MERVEFSLNRSKRLSALLCLLYGGSAVIILWLPMLLVFKIAGVLGCWYDFCRVYRLYANRSAKDSVVSIWQNSNGQWGCKTKEGYQPIGTLVGDSYTSSWILVLRFRFKNRSKVVIIPADAMSVAQYRILYVRLNFIEATPGVSSNA